MTYETFNYLCTQFETSYGLTAGEGWKNIRWIKCDSVSIFDIQHLYREGKIYFIHETNFTGFVIIEENLAETGALVDKPNYTFLDLDCCYSITFEPPAGRGFKSIADLMKNMIGTEFDPTVTFEHSTYTFKDGAEAIRGIRVLSTEPVTQYVRIYDDSDKADADIASAESGEFDPNVPSHVILDKLTTPGTYYMVVFADYGYDSDEDEYDLAADRQYKTDKCTIIIE